MTRFSGTYILFPVFLPQILIGNSGSHLWLHVARVRCLQSHHRHSSDSFLKVWLQLHVHPYSNIPGPARDNRMYKAASYVQRKAGLRRSWSNHTSPWLLEHVWALMVYPAPDQQLTSFQTGRDKYNLLTLQITVQLYIHRREWCLQGQNDIWHISVAVEMWDQRSKHCFSARWSDALFLNDVGLFKKQKQEKKFLKILYEHELEDVLSLKDNRATFWS